MRRSLLTDDAPTISEVVALAEDLLPGRRMSAWQRSWCTAETVSRFLRGRGGDVRAAAKILAEALAWREKHKGILSGSRTPQWQSDLRVLTRAESGHPIIYMCFVNVVGGNVAETVAHLAVALEAGVLSLRGGAQQFDVFADCHGFGPQHLDPRPLIPLMKMLKQPFRDRLRTVVVIEAPLAFSLLANVCRQLNPTLARKTKFLSSEEAVAHVRRTGGIEAAQTVQGIIALNRQGTKGQPGETKGRQLPSELDDAANLFCNSAAREVLPEGGQLSGKVAHAAGLDHGSTGQGSLRISARSRRLLELHLASEEVTTSRWGCCRRRCDRRV